MLNRLSVSNWISTLNNSFQNPNCEEKIMKKLFVITMSLALSASALALSCPEPRTNVNVKIDYLYINDVTVPFCYATEINSTNRFEIHDCSHLSEGSIVSGTVFTHSMGRDSQGNLICNYHTFVPNL